MKTKKKMSLAQRINILRAAVMGANDGILSVAGIVIGVAGAATSNFAIFISGIAGMLAGTVSMAMGEYVSVSAEKDSQKQAIATEKQALKDDYDGEYDFVRQKYLKKGIKPELVEKAVHEMMERDALRTMVRERYGFDVDEFTSPYAAAIAINDLISVRLDLTVVFNFIFPAFDQNRSNVHRGDHCVGDYWLGSGLAESC